MISKEQYEAQIARLSDLPCGLAMKGRETVAKCDPPVRPFEKRCSMCNALVWKSDTGESNK